MRIDRLSALGALAMMLFSAGCNGGATTAAPVPPAPPAAPMFQLLRFVQGSPDSGTGPSGLVDVCVDTQPFAVTQPFGGPSSPLPQVGYGSVRGLDLVNGPHAISVYASIGASAGAECATAPAPYLGAAPIATAALPAGSNVRRTIALGGTSASGTLGLYIFNEPTYPFAPSGFVNVVHNAAPVFSSGKPGIGFGRCTTTVTPCAVATAVTGGQDVAVAVVSTASAGVVNGYVASSMTAIPAGFYDGIGVLAGTPVPITSIASPTPIAFQAYIVQLYAVDAPAGGLNLASVVEQSVGYGF